MAAEEEAGLPLGTNKEGGRGGEEAREGGLGYPPETLTEKYWWCHCRGGAAGHAGVEA